MRKIVLLIAFMASIMFLQGCTQEKPQKVQKEVFVFAAASLKDSLTDIKYNFEKDKDIKLMLNFAASGTLQKQIEEGAPADLFILAGRKQMDALENENMIENGSRTNLLKNRLVLVVSKDYKDKIKTIADLADLDIKISIGEPETVPAGLYAKESLTSMKLWDKLSSKIVFAKDVKQVLTYVERGETAAGIVYASDASVIKDSYVVETVEENTHSPIVYPAAILSSSKDKDSSKMFLDYLMSSESQRIFEKYGFSTVVK
ncbi:MAG: molybdate ABC transporter substrate-binding protein [Caulobacteraceae bacterium]